jgi:trehalose 6-phosphate synthase
MLDQCDFEHTDLASYAEINERFARHVTRTAHDDSLICVQDYHLMHLALALRQRDRRPFKLTFFLHIPFPSFDVLATLPWHQDLLRALLAYDLIGFQTETDRRNFVQCVEHALPNAHVYSASGPGTKTRSDIVLRRHVTQARCFPIGIDFEVHARLSAQPEVDARVRELREAYDGRKIVLGVERLDYTKGLLQRLDAFESALEQDPTLVNEVVLLQLIVPSRERIHEYQLLRSELDRRVAEINARHATPSHTPIHTHHRSVARTELLSLYRAADVALVTPLKDGMNLVAKEFCASRIDDDGVLVLSRFAGAADQLGGHALLVDPYDREAVAATLRAALTLSPEQRRVRMRALRAIVREQDIERWSRDFLSAAMAEESGLSPRRAWQVRLGPGARTLATTQS